jgi:hypothetical protein
VIYEITGQPGHGKSLYGLYLARQFLREGRAVYAHGVTGLDYGRTGFLELVDPKNWQDVPDNSVVVIDECYSTFPNRNAASTVPPHVEALARHRHRGLDFILIHQQPNQVDPFVRGLVDKHYHVRRKFGYSGAVIKTWDHSTSNPIKDAPLMAPLWKYDKSIYVLYQSATMHTVKKSLPWYFYAALPLLAFVVWEFWRLNNGSVLASAAGVPRAPASGAPVSAAAPASNAQNALPTTLAGWRKALTPVVPGLAFTAPIFADQLHVQSHPRTLCVIAGDNKDKRGSSCACYTEQATALPDVDDDLCRYLAVKGYYDPFLDPSLGQAPSAPVGQGPTATAATLPKDVPAAPSTLNRPRASS